MTLGGIPNDPWEVVTVTNLQHVGRILSRTFKTDPYLEDIEQKWVLGKKSMVALIDRSNLFSKVFANYVEKDLRPDGNDVIDHAVNMGLAKHRFDSMTKPLGRLVRHIGAVIATALHIVNDRKGKDEGVAATSWLSRLTEEGFLQAAMMADASDETIMLIRICDTELADTADLPFEVAGFMDRVRFLFGVRGGCTTVAGYTSYALQVLGNVRRFHVADQHKSFGCMGGISQDVIGRALGRMRNWLAVIESVVAAEFPSFDVLSSFGIFNLDTDSKQLRWDPDASHFDRLARTFKVDPHQLAVQYQCFRPLAVERMRAGCASSGVAWQQAVMQTQRRHAQRERHPCDALLPVLIAQRTFIASTSGVEQGFAKALQAVSPQQRKLSAAMEQDLVKIVVDRSPDEEPAVLQNAQKVWEALHGKPRASPVAPRCHKGMTSPHTAKTGTEVGFLRARRTSVGKALAALNDGPEGPSPAALTDKQEKEVEFQRDKLEKRKFDAFAAGLLIDNEMPDEFRAKAMEHLTKQQKTDVKATRERARRTVLSKGGTRFSDDWFRGKSVHINIVGVELDIRRAALAKGMCTTSVLSEAQCFVVSDPTPQMLDAETRWAAVLLGGYVCVPSVLSSGQGAVIKFKAALHLNREVWVSPNFEAKHGDIAAVLRSCLAACGRGSKWRMLAAPSVADCAAQVARLPLYRRKRFIGLVVKSQAA